MIHTDHSLYTGHVSHTRLTPRRHRFRYRLSVPAFNLETLPAAFTNRWLWSLEGRNLVSFRRQDYLPQMPGTLAEAARALVKAETGESPEGAVMLLAQPRYVGLCFNPISLYFCHDAYGQPTHLIAEVHNTPWNERHPYVLTLPRHHGGHVRIDFDKALHVSPFMDMDMHYRMYIRASDDHLTLRLENWRHDKRLFSAGMQLARKPLDARSCASALISTPLMTLKILLAIYWQALRLWCKGLPLVTHPDKKAKRTGA